MTFNDASAPLARALAERGYGAPTDVQAAVLAKSVDGRDLLVSAQTGSGKTVAYGLAIGGDLLKGAETMAAASSPLALLIAPTRELALQVEREMAWLYKHAGAKIVACIGGMDPRRERLLLSQGAHIVVGTPGRLRDHIERSALDVSALAVVVLDEADEMLDLGFREDLEFILEKMPADRRTLMFSATIPRGIAALARRYQRDAERINVANVEGGHADIEYRAIRVAPSHIEKAVVNLLRLHEAQTAMVFCNTRESVRRLQGALLERGFSTVLLSGELSQHERNQSMQALRDGRARVCVATDVAARGIDLPDLGLVIHADLPHDAEALQHRSGRTGRAGRKGVSALLVPPARRRRAEQMLRDARVDAFWAGPPTAEEIQRLDQERMLLDPMLAEPPSAEDMDLARKLLSKLSAEHLGAALIKAYRAKLPAPEEIVDPGDRPPPREARDTHERRETRAEKRAARPPENARPPQTRSSKPVKERFLSGAVWFKLDIGRARNADPKWLLPMLCRKGNVEKNDIGAIRIFENETRIEIAPDIAEDFANNMRRPGGENIRVERAHDGAEGATSPTPRPPKSASGPSKPPKKPKQRQ